MLHRERGEEWKAKDNADHDRTKRLELAAVGTPVATDCQIRGGKRGGKHDARRADEHRVKGDQRRARGREREAERSNGQQAEQ